jgi:hypothetical protein
LRQVKGKSDRVARKFGAVMLAVWCSLATPAWAEDLREKTVDRTQHYVELTKAQMDAEFSRQGPYLWVERLGQDRRLTADAQLRAGEVVIERLEPSGHDRGFLWRMNTYWRFEQKDGGTYVECQSISLTRDIPAGLGWLIGPYVTSVPRESLTFTLATTRSAVLGPIKAPAAP